MMINEIIWGVGGKGLSMYFNWLVLLEIDSIYTHLIKIMFLPELVFQNLFNPTKNNFNWFSLAHLPSLTTFPNPLSKLKHPTQSTANPWNQL